MSHEWKMYKPHWEYHPDFELWEKVVFNGNIVLVIMGIPGVNLTSYIQLGTNKYDKDAYHCWMSNSKRDVETLKAEVDQKYKERIELEMRRLGIGT